MRHDYDHAIVALAVLAAAFAGLGAWDYWLILRGGVEASISRQLFALCQRFPILPILLGLAVGILAGHLFWPQE